jgi:hypothetical protein
MMATLAEVKVKRNILMVEVPVVAAMVEILQPRPLIIQMVTHAHVARQRRNARELRSDNNDQAWATLEDYRHWQVNNSPLHQKCKVEN